MLPGPGACCRVADTAGTHDASFALCNDNDGAEGPLVTRQTIKDMAAQITSTCAPGPKGNVNGRVYVFALF